MLSQNRHTPENGFRQIWGTKSGVGWPRARGAAMAKGIRSKVKRRFRTAKRGVVKRTVTESRTKPILNKLLRAAEGVIDVDVKPPNAFRSDEPDAVIPQHTFTPCTDFRSDKVTEAQYATSGNRRVTHPLNLLTANAEGEQVICFGPGAADGAEGGERDDEADEEDLPVAPAPVSYEDDRMNYDGTTKCSSRQRRRNRNTRGAHDSGKETGKAAGFAFWGRKGEKR